jgi:hypothetical protein
MTDYERGFDAGERRAFSDRRDGAPMRGAPAQITDAYWRGWWDGYTPRSVTWALRPMKTSTTPWWMVEPEHEMQFV